MVLLVGGYMRYNTYLMTFRFYPIVSKLGIHLVNMDTYEDNLLVRIRVRSHLYE